MFSGLLYPSKPFHFINTHIYICGLYSSVFPYILLNLSHTLKLHCWHYRWLYNGKVVLYFNKIWQNLCFLKQSDCHVPCHIISKAGQGLNLTMCFWVYFIFSSSIYIQEHLLSVHTDLLKSVRVFCRGCFHTFWMEKLKYNVNVSNYVSRNKI